MADVVYSHSQSRRRMKPLQSLFPLPVIAAFYLISVIPFVACTKNHTGYITRDSTIYVRDTTVLDDTVYDYTSGMIAYYNFNGGNLNDSSGHQNNITFSNAIPTSDRNGRPNNAYLFNGSSNYMSVPGSPSLNSPDNLTIYAIIKINGFYTGTFHANLIVMKGYDYANGEYNLSFVDTPNVAPQVDTGTEHLNGTYGDNAAQDNAPVTMGFMTTSHVSVGNWYRVAFTFDGTYAKLYINGVLEGTKIGTPPFTPTNTNLYIGAQMDPSTLYPYWFNGVIDEIRIYNRALPGQAIAQLSNLTD